MICDLAIHDINHAEWYLSCSCPKESMIIHGELTKEQRKAQDRAVWSQLRFQEGLRKDGTMPILLDFENQQPRETT